MGKQLLSFASVKRSEVVFQNKSQGLFFDDEQKDNLYAVIAAGGFIFYAVIRFMSVIYAERNSDTISVFRNEYVTLVVVAFFAMVLLVVCAPEKKWFNIALLSGISIFEYYVVVDYDVGWHMFRMIACGLIVLVLILNAKIFWTKVLIIISRFCWISLWGVFCIIFMHLLQDRNHNIAYLYMCMVTMLLIETTYSAEGLKLFSSITSKMSFLPSLFIVLSLIHTIRKSHIYDAETVLSVLIPMTMLAISCVCFCRYQVHHKDLKIGFKVFLFRIVGILPFIVFALVFSNIGK